MRFVPLPNIRQFAKIDNKSAQKNIKICPNPGTKYENQTLRDKMHLTYSFMQTQITFISFT